jgi:DNA-directed RNA polymerase specialized sigma24 family protein
MERVKLLLDTQLRRFRKGEISREKLESLIFLHIRENVRFYSEIKDADEAMDFLSWFYPRLKQAVDRYEEQGSSFDFYIKTLSRCSAKEYRRIGEGKRRIEASYWNSARAGDFDPLSKDSDDNPEKNCIDNEERKSAEKARGKESFDTLPLRINQKQVMILLLKNYYALSDAVISRAAGLLSISPDEIHGLVARMKEIREKQDREIWLLRERLHSQYHRLLSYEYRKSFQSPDSPRYALFQDRIIRHRKRLYNMRKRYRGMRKNASNKEIAQVLGVPKGTVDSALSAIRKRAEENDLI